MSNGLLAIVLYRVAWGLFLCGMLFSPIAYGAADPIRVGFFPMRGFNQYEDGKPAGYNVDYLEKIANYTRWTYDWVRLKSWDEALRKLEEGTIDLVGSAQMTPERLARFHYSAYSSGVTYAALLARESDDRMHFEDFEAFDGKRVGCVESYIRRDEFIAYAKAQGFTPQLFFYESTALMREALQADELDGIICSIMEREPGEKIVARFAPAPFYYITTKNKQALQVQLDTAMALIRLNFPNFEHELMERYYAPNQKRALSQKEKKYIKQHPVITIHTMADRSPVSFIDENDVFQGISPEVLRLIAKEAGFTFQIVPYEKGKTPLWLLKEGSIDLIAGVVYSNATLRDRSLHFTRPYVTGQLVMLGRKGEPFYPELPLKIAIPAGYQAGRSYIQKHFPRFVITEFLQTEDCMKAVQSGQMDVMLQNGHVVEEHLQGPVFADLAVISTVNAPEPLSIAMRANENPLLESILEKAIANLSDEDVQKAIINNTIARPYILTFHDFLLQYRNTLIITFFMGIAIVALIVYSFRQKKEKEKIIYENAERLRLIVDNINGSVISLGNEDKTLPVIYANNGFLSLLGLSRKEYESVDKKDLLSCIHPDDAAKLKEKLDSCDYEEKQLSLELRLVRATGEIMPTLLRGTVTKKIGEIPLLFCVLTDITEQRNIINMLEIEKERYRIIIDQSNDLIIEMDFLQKSLYCSPKFKKTFDWEPTLEDFESKSLEKLHINPEDQDEVRRMLGELMQEANHAEAKIRIGKNDGTWLWCFIRISCIRKLGKLIKFIGQIENIDIQERERIHLRELSQRDQLSGLFNKSAFYVALQDALDKNAGEKTQGAFFFIDIDNFKQVNDTLGHAVGDEALKAVAAELKKQFREQDIVARFGGDEFCVFTPGLSETHARQRAEALIKALRKTYGEPIPIATSASIGVALLTDIALSGEELMRRADEALYAAKEQGKNKFVLYTSDSSGSDRERQDF